MWGTDDAYIQSLRERRRPDGSLRPKGVSAEEDRAQRERQLVAAELRLLEAEDAALTRALATEPRQQTVSINWTGVAMLLYMLLALPVLALALYRFAQSFGL